jgi:hypothetical protein
MNRKMKLLSQNGGATSFLVRQRLLMQQLPMVVSDVTHTMVVSDVTSVWRAISGMKGCRAFE